MQAYNKFIAALIVPAIITAAGAFGITPDMPFSEAVDVLVAGLITAFFVWLVPNKN